MYMNSDIIKIIDDTSLDLRSMLYSKSISDKFFNFYKDNEHKMLEVKRLDYLYIKVRRLIFLTIFRIKSMFNKSSIKIDYSVTDVVQKYLISFFLSQGRPISSDIENLFSKIYIEGDDYVVINSVSDFYSVLFENTYSMITIEDQSGNKRNFINTTLIDAVTQILADNIIGWDPNTEYLLKGYKESFTMSLESEEVSLDYYREFEFKVYDVLDNLLTTMFKYDNYRDFLYSIYNPEWMETDRSAETIRRNLDILYIIKGIDDPQLLKDLQCGEILSNFSLKPYVVDDSTIVSDFDDILHEIPNLNVSLPIQLSVSYDGNNVSAVLNTGSVVDTLEISTDESVYRGQIKSVYDLCSSVKINITNNVRKSILDFVNNQLPTLSKIPISTYELQNISNHLLDKFKEILDTVDYTTYDVTTQWYDVENFFNNYDISSIMQMPKKYYETLQNTFDVYMNNIKQDFDDLLQDYGSFEYPVNFKFVINEVFSKEIRSYIKYLIDMGRKIDLAYCVMDFETRFPKFVDQIYNIIKPLLSLEANATVASTIEPIFETILKDLVINILPVFYFDIVSTKEPYYEENMLYGTYSNYSNRSYTINDIIWSVTNGFKPVVFPYNLLEYSLKVDAEKYILDLQTDLSVYLISLKTNDYYIDFTRGVYKFNVLDQNLKNLLSDLNYQEDIVLSSSKLSNFCSKYKIYPYEDKLYMKNEDSLIMFNYSDFIKYGVQSSYYFDFELSRFLPNNFLDKLVDAMSNINQQPYKINIIVTDLSRELIRARSRSFDNTIYSRSFYIIPLRVQDIITSDTTGQYVIDKYKKLVNTDFDFDGNIVNDYCVIRRNEFDPLDVIDITGRDLNMLQFNYRVYKTLDALFIDTSNSDETYDEIFQYDIILGSNLSEIMNTLKKVNINQKINYLINNYRKV